MNRDLYLRMAPELYRKRCVVGGMERVHNSTGCSRNEGVDTSHSPEFTMLEVDQAYTADIGGEWPEITLFGAVSEALGEPVGPDTAHAELLRHADRVGLAVDRSWSTPVLQRERFEAQATLAAAGDEEAMRLDEDFLRAIEYGIPPSGGMGMGLGRLLMALTGSGIRETILFPLVRPE